MRVPLLTLMVGLIFSWGVGAQAGLPDVSWQKKYGGGGDDVPMSFSACSDGGYVILGRTKSTAGTGDVSQRRGTTAFDWDYWVIKLRADGSLEWEKTYGGTSEETLHGDITQTSDGGYVIVGSTYSKDGDVARPLSAGKADGWIVKLKSDGTLDWQKTYGTTGEDYTKSVIETPQGHLLIGGAVEVPPSGPGMSLIPDTEGVVFKTDAQGNEIWLEEYSGWDAKNSDVIGLFLTADGNYGIAGRGGRASGIMPTSMSKNGAGRYLLAKTDTSGRELWFNSLGGSKLDFMTTAVPVADGGYILCGHTHSVDSVLMGVKKHADDISDLWIVKLDGTGQQIVWSKSYGGTSADSIAYMAATADGGVVIAANSRSTDGDVTGPNKGKTDIWVLKLDGNGDMEWDANFGGSEDDVIQDIIAHADGSIALLGQSASTDMDLAGVAGKGGIDYWIVKFDAPEIDSIRVTVASGGSPLILNVGETLQLEAKIYPTVLPQAVTWSIVPGTGTATIDAAGLLSHGDNGTVWAKAVWDEDPSWTDSIEVLIAIVTDGVGNQAATTSPTIHLYPNPASGQIVLHATSEHPELTAHIYELSGKSVWRSNLTKNELLSPVAIDISHLAPGLYLIHCSAPGYQNILPLIVQ